MIISDDILRLEDELTVKGWKKKKFCDEYGISTQVYNNWRERGIPHQHKIKISELLGLSYYWLTNGDEPRYADNLLLIAESKLKYGADNNDLESNKKAIVKATRFLYEHLSAQEIDDHGPTWTGETIAYLMDFYKDPASENMNETTILRLIANR